MPVLVGNKHICRMNADSKHVNVCTDGSMMKMMCLCVHWVGGFLGWEAESAAHHPTHQAQRLGLLMSSLAMLCAPLHPPHPLLDWEYADRAATEMDSHTHTHWSLLVCFDQTVVLQPVSSEKLRCWCLRWLCMCVCVCVHAGVSKEAVCQLSFRYRSLLESVSVGLHFK